MGDSNKVWNVPNQLSAARLLLSFVVFGLMPWGETHRGFYWAAFVVFVVAAGTDWLDGWYARKFDQVTRLGRVLDPFCDKMIICGTFIMLAVQMRDRFSWYASIQAWIAVVVMGREILVTALRAMIEQSGGDFSAKMAGKLKMVFQCIAAGSCLVALALREPEGDANSIPTWLLWTMVVSIWLALISTVQSGIVYVFAAASYFAAESRSTP